MGKRLREKQMLVMILLNTRFKHSREYSKAEWNKTKKIASNHFISFFLIYQQCKIYGKWVLIYSLQSEKKTGKYHKICPTKKEFTNYVIKRGMMRFTVGRSLFSNKIFATMTCMSKNCLILHNYPNNHKFNLIFFLTPQMHCYCTCLYTVNSNHDAHSLVQ